jgi:hypothetical protein
MGTFDEIYKRILFAANCQTQMELASILEISQSSISDAKRRQSIPSDWLIKLYDKFGVNPDWLRDKKEPMYLQGISNINGEHTRVMLEDISRGFLAKIYETFCEKTADEYVFKTIDEVALPKSLGKCSTHVFNYSSNGMEPSLPRLSLVGVAAKAKEEKLPVISGEIYALYLPQEGIIFRRIFHNIAENSYTLCFENPHLPQNTISFESLQEKLFGKVSWVLHKF